MANKLTYTNKVGLVPKGNAVNQWQDDDANELKTNFNLNDDRTTAVENWIVNFLNLREAQDVTYSATPIHNVNLGPNAVITLAGDVDTYTLTNIDDGESGKISVIQNVSGGYGITSIAYSGLNIRYQNNEPPTASVISSGANEHTVLSYERIGNYIYFEYYNYGAPAIVGPSVILNSVTQGTTYDELVINITVTAGDESITERGAVLNTSTGPTVSDIKEVSGSGAGTFDVTVTGLDAETLYYVKGYATTPTTTTYSNELNITTESSAAPPTWLATADYYIKPTGSDTADGTSESTAWQTVSKVNSSTFAAGDVIAFEAGGVWEETLIPPSSGTVGNVITFGTYGTGDKAVISGSDELSLTWSVHSGNIYKATYSTAIDQLFLDGERQQLARYPNTGYHYITTVNNTTQFISTDLDNGTNYDNAVWIGRTGAYIMHTQNVSAYSGQTITLDAAPYGGLGVGEGFFLCNKLEFLNHAGQWFNDTATNTLYVWTPAGTSPINYNIRASVRDYGINITNKSYVTIQDIKINQSGEHGIYIYTGNYVTIDNNDITYPDQKGIYITNNGSDYLTITNNYILSSTRNGMDMYIENSLVQDNTVVDNAEFLDINKFADGDNWGTAINSRGDDTDFYYNRIFNTGYDGINWKGLDCNIKWNYIDGASMVLQDGGGIYTYNANTDYTKNGSMGSVVSYNIVKNVWGNEEGYDDDYDNSSGIYMDDGQHDILIEYNTVIGAGIGIFLHENSAIDVFYNTVYNATVLLFSSVDFNMYGDNQLKYNIAFASDRIGSTVWWQDEHQRMTKQNYSPYARYDYNSYHHNYATSRQFSNDYDFAGWKAAISDDYNSTFNDTQFTTQVEEIFYNATKVAVAQDLSGGTYENLSGGSVTSLTLQPFTSQILIKTA